MLIMFLNRLYIAAIGLLISVSVLLYYNSSIIYQITLQDAQQHTKDKGMLEILAEADSLIKEINYGHFYGGKTDTIVSSDHLQQAIELYEQVYTVNNTDPIINSNLAILYALRGKHKIALQFIERAKEILPKEGIFCLLKGNLLESVDLTKAFEAYQEAITRTPSIIDSEFFKHIKNKYPTEVNQLLKTTAHALNHQDDVITKAKYAKLQYHLGNKDKSIALLKEVTKDLPNLSRPWLYLAILDSTSITDLEKEQHFKRAIFTDPGDPTCRYLYAHFLADKGKYDFAIEELVKSLQVRTQAYKELYLIRKMMYPNSNITNDGLLPFDLKDKILPIPTEEVLHKDIQEMKDGKSVAMHKQKS